MTDKKYKGKVVLTYGRSLMALTAAHSLGERDIEVVGCDDVGMTVLDFSRYVSDYFIHASSDDDLEKYLDDMEENIIKHAPDDDRPYILMPMFRDAKLLAKHRERFEPLIKIAAPLEKSIHMVEPKDNFARLCQKLDLPMPETRLPHSAKELRGISDSIEYPVLIKPTEGVGGRGIKKVETVEELEEAFQASLDQTGKPPMIQELLEGKDYCFAAICDKGEMIAPMAYTNLYQFPKDTGAGIARETIDPSPFVETARKLLKALKWHGVVQIDFRWTGKETDEPRLIEVNPRFWAGLFHSVESGVDYPWLLYQLYAQGKITEDPHAHIGAKTKVPGLWTISALQDIAHDEERFDKVKEAWESFWDGDDKSGFKEKFLHFKDDLEKLFSVSDLSDKIEEMNAVGKQAKSEFDFDDSPMVSLGILFIASSLVRHKKLPPELKS